MEAVVAIPALVAAVVAWRYSTQAAFLGVYLPVLLLLPDYYRWVLAGLPDPTFSQAVILPIAALFLVRHTGHWRFSATDWLMLGLAFSMSFSEYLNAGYPDAQNLMFSMLTELVFPYMLAKGLIEPYGLRVRTARRMVFLLFVVAVVSWYEFKFGLSPFQRYLAPLFPDQGAGWVTTFRYGFARIAGPYGHAILAGMLLGVGYRLQRWLEWCGAWEPEFRWLGGLPVSKARLITIFLLAGMLMTVARGPWVGGILAAVVVAVGRARNRKRAFLLCAAGVVFVGIPAAAWLYSYISVGRAHATTLSQETAAYRKELIDKYVHIAVERKAWGWGVNGWPKVPGMPSIDNYYLLLALRHGFVATGLLLLILLSTTVRLFADGMRRPPAVPRGAGLGFTLAGVMVSIAVTLATVYLGTTAVPVFALLVGWSEGYLIYGRRAEAPVTAMPAATPAFAFRRVVA
ncbi:MAG TPA: O-antigen ligase family protein [Bryobacteraceae bacterium]|nr:O-antigen ligase family protein [Bryobacteraceae bacterium]